jgi:hypothetical protein
MSQTIIGAIAGILAVGVPTIIGLALKGIAAANAKADAALQAHALTKQAVDALATLTVALVQKVGPVVQADLASGNVAKISADVGAALKSQAQAVIAAAATATPA